MPAKKKTSKIAKNKAKKVEKQIETIEENLETYEKVLEKQKQKEEEENKRKITLEEKVNTIREDLKTQLLNQSKLGKQFDDMIEDYIFFVKLKEELQYDIKMNGIRYKAMTGNGYTTDKPNESVQQLVKVNAQMLKILQDLNLKAPDEGPEVGDGKDDLLS